MKIMFSVLIAFMVLASSATAITSDSPFIVAHKKVSLTRLKSGSDKLSVTIDIYNQGSATAYDVSLTDDGWPSDTFELVDGKTSTSYERLDAGSIVSHSFVLESKVKGEFQSSPAVIKFRIPTKTTLQEAFSTPIQPLDILADRPPENKFDWVKRLFARYGSLVSVISIVVLFVYLVASPSSVAKANKKRR
ncbi:hypothetical protein ACHQM5_007716 [Ranunculus cassubicifolius]